MTSREIIVFYDFPHRFIVRFACHCARVVLATIKNPDERSVKALIAAERFGNGEKVNQEELNAAASAAATAHAHASNASNATYAARTAIHTATSAAHAAVYTATNAAYAAHAAAYAIAPSTEEKLKSVLLTMINTELCEVQRLLIGLTKQEIAKL